MHEHPTAAEVADLFQRRGHSEYGGEAVTQLEHALQAAMFAEKSKAPAALIVAALLHDIGHVLHDLPDDAPDDGVDDMHEELGHHWLTSRFIPEVCEPVRLHVAAKRYLCSVDAKYMAALSEPSRVSLSLQGGPMTKEEADQFASGEHFQASLVLRRWDDAAKVVDLQTPPLEHFLNYIPTVSASLEQSAAS